MSEHLNSFFSSEFVSFLFHFFSFLAKCRMQMLCPNYANEIPWSVLPMWYVLYAIDRLLTIDLDVNFSMNAKCDASLDFFDANAFLQGCRCEMSIWYTCLLSEMQFSWCRCPFVGMQWCKHKLLKNSLYFQNQVSLMPETQNVFKTRFIIPERVISFFELRSLKIGDHC